MVEEERAGGEPVGGFLPPEPAGPEPDLAARKPAQPAAGDRVFLPPQGAAPHEYSPPPQQPSGPGPRGGAWQQPPAGVSQPPLATVPDNGDALAGVILSVSAAVLLVLSVGTSTIISIVCAALGIHYSRKGRARVDRGETPKHRGVAQAGFITGIVTLVLSILMTLFWVAFGILYATNDDFRQDLEDELDGDDDSPGGLETSIRVAVVAVRVIASVLR